MDFKNMNFGDYALRLLQNQAKRNQQANMSVNNAEMMRNSPWTGLGSTSALAQNQNMQFNPSADMAQQTSKFLGFAEAKKQPSYGEDPEVAEKQKDALNKFDLNNFNKVSDEDQMLLSKLFILGGTGS